MQDLYNKKEKVNEQLEIYIENKKERLVNYLVKRTNYENIVK